MSNEENWRTTTDAGDYFGKQNKKLAVADRRPVIRKPSDLVGPGIGAAAIRIDDFNNVLATYNGYYASVDGALNAPAAGSFVGITVMDSELGGVQQFDSLSSGLNYRRRFLRNPSDPESISWGAWQQGSGEVPIGAMLSYGGGVAPGGWLICDGASYSIALYPLLFDAIGMTFGGSGGSFNVPDARDRALYGLGSAWLLGGTDGLAAGARTKDIEHAHNVATTSSGAHSHTGSSASSGVHDHGGVTGGPSATTARGTTAPTSPAADPAHTHTIPSGGGHTHPVTVDLGGDHSHSGVTLDLSGVVAPLRGLGANVIIRHGQVT